MNYSSLQITYLLKMFVVVLVFAFPAFILSCSSENNGGSSSVIIELTTPENDAIKCSELLYNTKTLKELDEAKAVVYQYVAAYDNALNEGEITIDEWDTFKMKLGHWELQCETQATYILENQGE